jgi:hypothetical protein
MRCEEIRDQAACIALLPDSDPARQAALEHAAGCDDCRAELERAEKAMKLLDLDQSGEPPDGALERVAAAVRARQGHVGLWLGAGVLVAAVGVDVAERVLGDRTVIDFGWLWPSAIVLVSIALIGAMLAPRGRAGILGLLIGAAALFPLLTLTSNSVDRDGALCFGLELASAGLPLLIAAVLVGTRRMRASALSFAIASAAGALAGEGAAQMTCPYRVPHHLFAYHVGAMIVAACVGALIGGIWEGYEQRFAEMR